MGSPNIRKHILAYLDGGVTNSTPVAAGVDDSAVGYPGVVRKPSRGNTLQSPGVGEVGPREGSESGLGPALPSPRVGYGSNTMCSTMNESAPNPRLLLIALNRLQMSGIISNLQKETN